MTASDDFDRISRAWLDLMPDEAPDRAVHAVLREVATTPQVRRWGPLSWRPLPMNRFTYAIAAAAIAVAIGGAVLLLRPGADEQSAGPPGPSASPSASQAGAYQLEGRWMGGPSDLVDPGAGSSILLRDDALQLSQSNANDAPRLTAQLSFSNAGLIHLESSGPGPCDADTGGDYDWSISPSNRVFRLSPIEDGCTQRAAALAGIWWRMGCTIEENCLGLLDAGTYKSQFLAPRLDQGATWSPVVGGVTYTVPEGWANSSDWPDTFELVPAEELPPVDEANRSRNINVMRQPSAMTQDRPCTDQVEPDIGRTVDDLIAWLPTVPGLITTEPTPITIGGYAGQSMDIRLDQAWTATCEGDPDTSPVVTYLNPGIAVRGDQTERLILLDLGDGDVVSIGIWTRDQATFDAFAPEAMSVIESFTFD